MIMAKVLKLAWKHYSGNEALLGKEQGLGRRDQKLKFALRMALRPSPGVAQPLLRMRW